MAKQGSGGQILPESAYGLVAYLAVWGKSGIKSFVFGQNGKVYESGLSSRISTAISAGMTGFDPDTNLSLVE